MKLYDKILDNEMSDVMLEKINNDPVLKKFIIDAMKESAKEAYIKVCDDWDKSSGPVYGTIADNQNFMDWWYKDIVPELNKSKKWQ